MEFEDEGFVLAARPHGETGAIVEVLTARHGRWVAHVAGGASRRLKPILQPGSRVRMSYRARVADQLGAARLEGEGEGASALFDDPLALAGLAAAAAVVAGALPEREPHDGAFFAMEALVAAFSRPDIWPAVLVRFEMGLLQELGFGLDLSRCAVTGSADDLAWVSPRTGRAVSAAAGEPYRDRLLPLPPFLLSAQGGLSPGDIAAGLTLTGRFLQDFVFAALNRPLPPARARLIERLGEAGRL
ncbi:DNA repair protein RecO [Phenylobacterium sp.]|uniref:DNA repair protein RecO n=1 Tax=Phenylobacterium sp. TaxID=1871053 RepID=UPI002BB98BFF|nr:DNA repair protein RecO [Phenylobacterium sp.]HLZ77685.1 DNA repair protein RecO [Phenylobacterium sp.]